MVKTDDLKQYLSMMIDSGAEKIVISRPDKGVEFRKLVIEKKNNIFQISKYTDRQVFHENVQENDICDRCVALVNEGFRQINGWSGYEEHIILISKKGVCNYRKKKLADDVNIKGLEQSGNNINGKNQNAAHNRKKNYILEEGMQIPPLVDMGVFTGDGKVINAMYDKYKQLNRFIEIIDDEIKDSSPKELNVIDFGCGKSYLTFVVYYYLTEVRHMKVNMIGLDLKSDVIQKCNDAARKYNYTGLKFEMGDINGYRTPFEVDMVITLHACDTATDYALYNAVQWNAGMIFSVPCCQHELNRQMRPRTLSIMGRYGIIKERFAALATDAIRGNLLEYVGYKTQLLEFIDLEHTPKNILIRAVKRPMTNKGARKKALGEAETLMEEFGLEPTLYKLLVNKDEP